MNTSFITRSGRTLCIAIAMLSLWLAACAPAKEAPAPAAQETPATPTPQYGGAFYLGARQSVDHLDWWEEAGVKSNIGLAPVYEHLVNHNDLPGVDWRIGGEISPVLAEGWEQPNDTTYIFHIRKGVRWHDGTEFTAQDVVWSYEFIRDPAKRLRGSSSLAAMDTIQALDKYTVRMTTKGPSAVFLENLTDKYIPIYPRHVFERGDSFKKVAIGTGPFKLKAFDPIKGATYVKNEDYWRKGKPYLDRVEIFWPLDPSAMIAAFKAKQVDIIKVEDKAQMDSVLAVEPTARWEAFQQSYEDPLYLKLDRPPLNDIRVRRAMHLAIDRQAMINTLTFGMGVVNPPGIPGGRTGWVIPQEELLKLPGYRQPKDQDITEAKRLLTDAGYPNGFKITLRYGATYTRPAGEAPLIARDLSKTGIEVKLDAMEAAAFQKAITDGDFEMWINNLSEFFPERPWGNYFRSGGPMNRAPINDPELDALIDQNLVTMNEQKRKEIYLRIQRLLLDKLYVIPGVTWVGFLIWQPYVHDWVDNRAGQAANESWSWLWMEADKAPKGR